MIWPLECHWNEMYCAWVTQKEKCKDGCLSVDHAVVTSVHAVEQQTVRTLQRSLNLQQLGQIELSTHQINVDLMGVHLIRLLLNCSAWFCKYQFSYKSPAGVYWCLLCVCHCWCVYVCLQLNANAIDLSRLCGGIISFNPLPYKAHYKTSSLLCWPRLSF